MNLLRGISFRTFNIATLQLAALLVPRRQRGEWLKEWQSELWHVRQACAAEDRISRQDEQKVAAFCLGAFQDALCLRRHLREGTASGQYLAAASHCIVFLAG